MRLLLILLIITHNLCYTYFSPTAYYYKEESTWNPRQPNHGQQRYSMVLPQLGNSYKWKDMMDQSSVNHDIVGYDQLFNHIKNVNKLKQLNKGFSYSLIEDK
jgi:hypothetical protein